MKLTHAIHIGIDSASIAKMKDGEPCIIKSDILRDVIPMCVSVNKKGSILVGDAAYNAYRSDLLKNQKGWKNTFINSFVEFGRTIGTDKMYYSSNANKSFSSTELVAEVIKTLLSFEKETQINAAVITIPDAFKANQINAIREAGKLAGLEQVEVVQESIAVALAYGLETDSKESFRLVFDLDTNIFEVTLLKFHDGKLKIVDSKRDDFLGGKDLENAVVDHIIIPHIQENFDVDETLNDESKKSEYRAALKFFAEEIINNLSFNSSYNIYVDPGDCGEDDNGEEIEIDLTVTQDQLKEVLTPVYQKAIDCSLALLKGNNLIGSSLNSLLLVGGPTLSPILRDMLERQICKPHTGTDPLSAKSIGAVLYASTIDVSEEASRVASNRTKIQLEIDYDSTTVDLNTFVAIKIIANKTEGIITDKIYAEVTRSDKVWSSGRVEIDTIGEVIEIELVEGKTNIFEVLCYDERGRRLECEPNLFKIERENKIDASTLLYNIGTEVLDESTDNFIFKTIMGLESGKLLPAIGFFNFKTKNAIRSGVESDFIKIPIYKGGYGSENTRVIYNEHVCDIIISGADLPSLLPENSDVDLTISVDRSERITVNAYFPSFDFTTDTTIRTQHKTISINQVEDLLFELTENDFLSSNEFQNYFEKLSKLKQKNDLDTLKIIQEELKNYGREV